MEKVNPFLRFWNLISLSRSDVGAVYFYALLSGLVNLSLPLGIQAIIGFVLGASMVTSIYILIILVVFGVAAVGIMQINQMKIIEKIQQKIFTRYAFEFADKIPRFDLLTTDRFYLPEKVNRFFDVLIVQKSLSKLLLEVPIASIQLIFGLLLLAVYHPFFIVFGLTLLLVLTLIFKFTGVNGLKTSLQESVNKYKTVGWLEEMAKVINPFKLSYASHLNLTKTDDHVSKYLHSRTDHFKVLLVQYKTLVVTKVAITLAMLAGGSFLLLRQQLNIGEFIAAEIVVLMVINAVEKLIINLDSVYDVATGLEKLATVTENLTERDGKLALEPTNAGLAIDLIDFSFAFPNGRKLLSNTNIHIPAGSLVAVSPADFSGKSTFLKVLAGHYQQFSGSMLINKIPLGNYALASLRERIGLYLNQREIFIGSVLENILMGRNDINSQEIMSLAAKCGLSGFLDSLPEGFETPVDPNGKNLPSDYIKRICLLRTLLGKPDLLLLEDPWQMLTGPERQRMMAYLLSKPNNATIIVVANDPEFSRQCDYQIILNNKAITIISNHENGTGNL
ncbi:ATP-binding cassette domain-containing protein [Dyadobacter psychrophilus]|uniref:ABC-type bacteriocin/lantibiotic exporter, contains an N-terminal double-glycine peptidase domain n=1 Tax=Dyadobacter psychrophilus TaxID=651661 RepID=A0A1T5DYR9_9BACT|nr:ABC transporter ATP-binding protein [Dyadobacter psychrophilus]SKB76861.1 ABC-type bacteriocin/lantibiotic exporter, contains an N-terminal double-glycine peptidase domain [Dyadobacter psychrophilus]